MFNLINYLLVLCSVHWENCSLRSTVDSSKRILPPIQDVSLKLAIIKVLKHLTFLLQYLFYCFCFCVCLIIRKKNKSSTFPLKPFFCNTLYILPVPFKKLLIYLWKVYCKVGQFAKCCGVVIWWQNHSFTSSALLFMRQAWHVVHFVYYMLMHSGQYPLYRTFLAAIAASYVTMSVGQSYSQSVGWSATRFCDLTQPSLDWAWQRSASAVCVSLYYNTS